MADSTMFRAKADLRMPNSGVLAHTEGSEFLSTPGQLKELGWADDTETVSKKDAALSVAAPTGATTPASSTQTSGN